MLWRILFAPNAWFMGEKSSIITHYLAAPGVGEEFTPHIYNYIVLPQYPPHYPSITTRVSRASQKVSAGRLHRAGFDGFASTPCEMQKKILFLSKKYHRLHIKVFVQSILLKKVY